ncbi:CaiB/BaiF CoA transferase family protein [Arthrobacter globiformis]|uniref:CaiB/BaiF CoA transferase family protein n=1 Tax=Arthrobacter globiformis TaxID=1665 RepID=UPI0015547C0A|nr:CoA transferase [Arthrobacter globiformis]
MSGPLAGVRVLDLTHFVAGPWCTMLLADLGAEVIKLEPPGGEIGRGMGSVFTAGESAIFLGFNRGKRSISLDLKQPEGLAAALKLAEQADVVVQNFRPGTAERLGIGAGKLRAKHPRLIYCTISAFGPDGPYSSRPANDPIIQALTGSMSATGQPESRPVRMGVSLPDFAAAVLAATGILAALHSRSANGSGSTIDLNLLDTQLYAQTDLISAATAAGAMNPEAAAQEVDGEDEPDSIRGAYVCGDGLSLWLDTAHASSTSSAPTRGAGMPHAPRAGRERVAALLRTRPRKHWLDLLGQERTRAVPVLGLSDVLPSGPHRTLEVNHPSIGRLRQIRTPVTMEPPWPTVNTPPPRLGQHTREVLRELGFLDNEIDRLAARGIVPTAVPTPRNCTTPNQTHTKEQQ